MIQLPRVEGFGAFLLFTAQALKQSIRLPFRLRLILSHIAFIGHDSMAIILLTGFFTGAVFGLQIGSIFSIFRSEAIMGGATGLALATELAPLTVAFLLAGRVGSAITAEIATMVVNEQIDAMEAMAVDPISYLVVPRLFAGVIVMPLLCGIFMLVGVIGAYVVGYYVFNVDQGVFHDKLKQLVSIEHVFKGLRKMVVFGFVIICVACRYGLTAQKGAKGVGVATTESVVVSLLTILVCDVFISYLEVVWID